MFRKIQRSSFFFSSVKSVQSEMKVEKESPAFPLQEFPWLHFPLSKSSQSTVASAALILKSSVAYLSTCSLFHFSSPLENSSAGDVKQTKLTAKISSL